MFLLPNYVRAVLHRPVHLGRCLAAVPVLIASLGGVACAGRSFISEPDPYVSFKGDMDNLPVNCGVTPEELVEHARRIPAVQEAMRRFLQRGYVAHAGADTAVSACSRPVSIVALAYEKPGAWIDSNHVVAPTILVTTVLGHYGEPLTTVTGGLLVVDGQAQVLFCGDSLSMFRATDPSFDVAVSGGGGKGVIPEAADGLTDQEAKLNKYVRCAGWGTISCFASFMRLGGMALNRIKIAAMMAEPELGLAILGGCLTVSMISCLQSL